MITNDNAKTYNISANISPIDIELCKVYIRGAVNAICNYSENAEFSVRILFGGNNRDWYKTPLQKIYDYHHFIDGKDCETAAKSSAKDVVMLLKTVLEEDSRNFEIVRIDTGNVYKLA